MSRIFVDTSAFLAFLDRADDHHASAAKAFQDLAASRAEFWTSSYVLVESSALIRNRLGMEAVRRFGQVVRDSLEILWVDEDVHWRAWNESSRAGRRGPGLVDWSSFILMKDHRLKTALAIDRHFQAEFEVLPGSDS